MLIEKFKELIKEVEDGKHKNYQYNHLTRDERKVLAQKSFEKIPEIQKEKAIKEWAKYGLEDDFAIYCRFLAQTNLFFLCKLLEKYSLVSLYEYTLPNGEVHNTHEEICNEFFVRKDPANYVRFEQFANAYTGLKDRMLLVPRGGFKALDLETDIPTPTGFKKMHDVSVGDTVIGDSGFPCTVTGVSDVFVGRKCYEVVFSTGESIVADADHLWITDARRDRDKNKGKLPSPSVKTTQEIKDTLMCRKERNHRINVAGSVQSADKEYIISPYVLGCWLGDGTSSNSNLTCYDSQIIEEIKAEGEVIREAPHCNHLYVFNGGKGHKDYRRRDTSLMARLRKLGLLNNKHIPETYLFGSYSQRLSLLQGLMDTDGTCDDRGQCYFTNTNKILIFQVRQLIASLGLKPFNVCEYDATLDGEFVSKSYQVGFVAYKTIPVFRLLRKKLKQQDQKKVTLSKYRQIVAVNEVESRPTKCIMVDSPNHTYLVGRSYIPTHNSSIDMADCVQYIICWPEITILILTGVNQLAVDFVGEVKQHFTLEESQESASGKPIYGPKKLQDHETGEWSISLFQVLFPEHCIEPDDGPKSQFNTPAGGDEKEPTLRAASIEQTLSGWHFGVIKLDDVVTNENSLTPSRMLGIINQININEAMLHPYGFMDVIGTWYDEKDYYGITIKREEEMALNGEPPAIKIYIRAAWWPTAEAKAAGKIESEMTEKDYVLWFPTRLTYEFLLGKKKKSPETFPIKYLNDPRILNKVKFPRELLVRRTVPYTQLPKEGLIVTTIDTAYSVKSWADYTVILTAVIFGGRFFIIDMVRGRFNEFELPQIIAHTAFKWKPKRIAIEESMGVKWMGVELRREMDKLAISIPVTFVSLGVGSKKNSKAMKAKPVLRLLGDERLFFSLGCNNLTELYNELEAFTGTNDDTHDDIVSALSLLVDQFGAYADMDAKVNFASEQFVADQMERERHNQVYGLGRYAKYNQNWAIDDNPVTAYQVEHTTEIITDVDPLQDLMA